MMKLSRLSLAATLAFLLLHGVEAGAAELDQILAYDSAAPLGVKSVGVQRQDGVAVEDITFASVTGGAPTQAYVVRPENAAGKLAGVLFVHWYAPRYPTSNRTQYLEEAKDLARRGTVSLLVSTFWTNPDNYKSRKWEDDYQRSVNQAKELRRALDVLLAQPGVDPQRVAYVGHDYGAMFGAVVAGADPRPKAFVLIAGASRFPDWYLFGSASGVPAGEAQKTFREQFARIDPLNVIGRSKASVFFQYGEEDRFTPREDFIALYMAATGPKRIATYPSDHPMDAEIIRLDRTAWLAGQLGLPASPAKAGGQ